MREHEKRTPLLSSVHPRAVPAHEFISPRHPGFISPPMFNIQNKWQKIVSSVSRASAPRGSSSVLTEPIYSASSTDSLFHVACTSLYDSRPRRRRGQRHMSSLRWRVHLSQGCGSCSIASPTTTHHRTDVYGRAQHEIRSIGPVPQLPFLWSCVPTVHSNPTYYAHARCQTIIKDKTYRSSCYARKTPPTHRINIINQFKHQEVIQERRRDDIRLRKRRIQQRVGLFRSSAYLPSSRQHSSSQTCPKKARTTSQSSRCCTQV